MILCSQYGPSGWHERVGEGAPADAAIDRLAYNSRMIHIKGTESMRERMAWEVRHLARRLACTARRDGRRAVQAWSDGTGILVRKPWNGGRQGLLYPICSHLREVVICTPDNLSGAYVMRRVSFMKKKKFPALRRSLRNFRNELYLFQKR